MWKENNECMKLSAEAKMKKINCIEVATPKRSLFVAADTQLEAKVCLDGMG